MLKLRTFRRGILFKHYLGGFHKWGYPQIILFNGIFQYKPTSYWGAPMTMAIEPPGIFGDSTAFQLHFTVSQKVVRPASAEGLRPTRCGAYLPGVPSPSRCAPATQRCLGVFGALWESQSALKKCPKKTWRT